MQPETMVDPGKGEQSGQEEDDSNTTSPIPCTARQKQQGHPAEQQRLCIGCRASHAAELQANRLLVSSSSLTATDPWIG